MAKIEVICSSLLVVYDNFFRQLLIHCFSLTFTLGRKQNIKQIKLLFNKGKAMAKISSDNVVGENLVELQQLPLFNFEELAIATNNFHLEKKLGQGGLVQYTG